jgi:hypothetical protein
MAHKIKGSEKRMNQENKNLGNVDIGNNVENLTEFDECTIENANCGYRTKDGFCLHKEQCAFQQSAKWLSFHSPTEKSTIETILEIEKKQGRLLKPQEILELTPSNEIDKETNRYIIDFKGNVFDFQKHRIIRRNLKL